MRSAEGGCSLEDRGGYDFTLSGMSLDCGWMFSIKMVYVFIV